MERLRRTLTADLILLQSLHSSLNHTRFTQTDDTAEPDAEWLDDNDGEADPSARDQSEENNPNTRLPPEHISLHLPSTQLTDTHHLLSKAKLAAQIKQATQNLATLHDGIAQKSFQYSHVMRSAPSKGFRTCSRSVILVISDRISHYFRIYCRVQAAMVRLGADERTLNRFKLLTRDNVKASTAILNSNITGSSTIRLSWIWKTGPKLSGSAPDATRECKP